MTQSDRSFQRLTAMLENNRRSLRDRDAAMTAREARRVATPTKKLPLGDAIELGLASLGITPESYVEFKEKFGLPPTCGCAERKRWLNKFGETFGVNHLLGKLLHPPAESTPPEPPREESSPSETPAAPQAPDEPRRASRPGF